MPAFDRVVFTGAEYSRHAAFWEQFLPAYQEGFYYRPGSGPTAGREVKTYRFPLPGSVAGPLLERVRGQDSGLFVCVLTAFGFLLSKYSARPRVVLHSPLLKTKGEVPVKGAGVVPLLLHLEEQRTLKETLQQVQQHVRDGYAYQHYPTGLLRDGLPEPAFSSNILVGYRAIHADVPADAHYDLALHLVREDDRLAFEFEYREPAFGADFVHRLAGHLSEVLLSVNQPSAGLGALNYLSRQERTLLDAFTAGPVAPIPAATVHELFERQAARTPEATAVVFGERLLSYRVLNERANRLAHYLRAACGVQPDELVGVLLDRSEWMLVALLGVLKAGGAYLPVDPAHPADRSGYILDDSRVRIVVTQPEYAAALHGGGRRAVLVAPGEEPPGPAGNPGLRNQPADAMYVMYTSGSTGRPKGVVVTHHAVVNLLERMAEHVGITPADAWLAVTTYTFDISVLELFLPLLKGARVIIADAGTSNDPTRLIALLGQTSPTLMQATPSMWSMLFNSGWEGSRHLKLLTGGEQLSGPLGRKLAAHCGRAWNVYGPTEATIWSTIQELTPESNFSSIGKPLGNTQAYVLDGNLRPLPPGITGEIYLGGEGLAREYLHLPALTGQRFVRDPLRPERRLYRTGDLGRWLPDGSLEFAGRSDGQVKIRGHRVEVGEVQYWLEKHEAVEQAVVISRGGPGETELVAFLKGTAGLPDEGLRSYLGDHLPPPMIPAHFKWLTAWPLTANGKVDHQALSRMELLSVHRPAYRPPSDAVEAGLKAIWEEVLGVAYIGIHDNFFEVGGNSLKIAQLQYAIGQQFPSVFKLSQLFTHATIAGQAVKIRESTGVGADEQNEISVIEF